MSVRFYNSNSKSNSNSCISSGPGSYRDGSQVRPISALRFWASEGSTQHNLKSKGWNSQVHREFTIYVESTNLSRDEDLTLCFDTWRRASTACERKRLFDEDLGRITLGHVCIHPVYMRIYIYIYIYLYIYIYIGIYMHT